MLSSCPVTLTPCYHSALWSDAARSTHHVGTLQQPLPAGCGLRVVCRTHAGRQCALPMGGPVESMALWALPKSLSSHFLPAVAEGRGM